MTDLPEWAESMVEPAARQLAPIILPYIEGYEEVPPEHIWSRPRYEWIGLAVSKITAEALAVALPLIAEHMAEVAIDHESGLPPRHWMRSAGKAIAAAVRREATPHKP